jgi:hypothetical protein
MKLNKSYLKKSKNLIQLDEFLNENDEESEQEDN